jgi:hypothetical protein
MYRSSPGVIGGLFGLEPVIAANGDQHSPFASSSTGFFLNARCAIYAVCQSLKPSAAWLPSYLCGAVLDPFRKLNIPVRYYDAGPNFRRGTHHWVAEVQSGDLVLAIHYFGFPNTTFPADQLRLRGAAIIEDASQGLFVKQQYPESVCIVYSPRKFLGVPDGGVMTSSQMDALRPHLLESPPTAWWTSALAATQMRREFDLVGGENRWFPLFRHVEEGFPLGPYRSSDLTRAVIDTTDYQFVKKARRENYLALAERLKGFSLFHALDTEIVPVGFPVCVDGARRDAVLERLYRQNIYPPVHWRIDGIVPDEFRESHLLSRCILTLICDQRYTIADMTRQADAFLSAIN